MRRYGDLMRQVDTWWAGPVALLLIWAAASPVRAQAPERVAAALPPWHVPSSFSLSKMVPADACVYWHSARNPERDRLRPRVQAFWRDLLASDVVEQVKRLILPGLPAANRAEFEAAWAKAYEPFKAIDLHALMHNEVMLAARFRGLVPDVMIAFRCEPLAAEKNAKAMLTFVEALAGLHEDLQCIPLDMHGARTVILASASSAICLQAAARGDVIVLCLGKRPPELMDDALAMLSGKSRKRRLVDTPRFKQAVGPLGTPEDAIAFVDVKRGVEQAVNTGETPIAAASAWERIARRLVQLLGVFDHYAATTVTNGLRQTTKSVLCLASDADQSLLQPALCGQEAFLKFDQFVPADSRGFWLVAGARPAVVYDAILTSLRAEANDPDAFMADWEAVQQSLGIQVRSELFEWLDGRLIIVLPPAPEGQARPAASGLVVLLGVTDPTQAPMRFARLVERLRSASQSWPRPLSVSSVQVAGTSMKRLGAGEQDPTGIVFGMVKGWLMVATSAPTAEACIQAAQGQAETIRSDPRFRDQGLIPKGPVASMSYVDLSRLDRDLARWLGLIGLVGKLLPADGPSEPMKGWLSLIEAFRKPSGRLDFLSTRASLTRFTGRVWETETVTVFSPVGSRPPSRQP